MHLGFDILIPQKNKIECQFKSLLIAMGQSLQRTLVELNGFVGNLKPKSD